MTGTSSPLSTPESRQRLYSLRSSRAGIPIVGALSVFLGGAIWLSTSGSAETTDAAYVEAHSSDVAAEVSGTIADVLVTDNQHVKAGTPLLQIQSDDYQLRVAEADANVMDAEAKLAAARQNLLRIDAEESLARANIEVALTSARSAGAESARALAERRRLEVLAADGYVSRQNLERAVASAVGAEQNVARVAAEIRAASSNARVTIAQRPILRAGLIQAEANVISARAKRQIAVRRLGRTVVRAPIDGVVGNLRARKGDYAREGSRLLTIVPQGSTFVSANFKETQTSRMIEGQRATVEVDALPGIELTGKVESLAPASGSQFALLPFEPGSGNFTKIVQRVAVKIRFDPGQPSVSRLRPGLSATVRVRTDK